MPRVCPLCGSSARSDFSLPDRRVYQCTARTCGLRFAEPQPTDEQLAAYYAQYYYGGGQPVYENSPEAALRQIVVALERRLGPLTDRRILDFGCGIGTMSRLLLASGAQHVDAVESDPSARMFVHRELGIHVASDVGDLRRRQPTATYDLIIMMDVVEHVRAPVATLAELKSVLRSGGSLFVETPDAGSLNARLVRGRWGNYQNPTHLYYFTLASLDKALRAAGFTTTRAMRALITYPSHGPARRTLQTGLQLLGLDGALRVLARSD